MKLWRQRTFFTLFCFALQIGTIVCAYGQQLGIKSFIKINPLKLDSTSISAFIQTDSIFKTADAEIITFYQKRNYNYQWINEKGINESAKSLKNLLKSSPFDLSTSTKDCFKKVENGSIDSTLIEWQHLQLELQLTAAFVYFIKSNYSAQYQQAAEWFMPSTPQTFDSALYSFYSLKNKLDSINKYKFPRIDQLEKELYSFLKLQKDNKWTPLPYPKKSIKPGDKDSLIVEIRNRLYLLKDVVYTDSSNIFDEALKQEVINFQETTGLKPDGIIGKNFIQSLNISPQKRLVQLLVNIQRLKWLPENNSSDHILVNIPEFEMHVYQGSELCWSSPVVVGKPSSSTALFSGNIKYIVFSPYWNVPRSIIKNEIIPEVKKNPAYVNKEQLEFMQGNKVVSPDSIDWKQYPAKPFPYTIRQKPGNANSLGLVKFLFPNEYDIYLHDTPSKRLFQSTTRSFSHGCIRISEPQKLAEYLLRNDLAWDSERIILMMTGGKELWVTLKQSVPVSIVYLTAWVDDNGTLNFRDDVYGLDKEIRKLLIK
ncbi:hypothetical protein C3K47_01005 [Solitalea longa]|uniref:L,D-TPase catalytic domain-containing protein n=1 Tax=Solitalea longa TaxID=2079460 RepID=A0A2S5A968_9SPHI|nr:L,D-transpeptidase family protein [Solitalea longa]POY39105.1 hypothetical protein C3K47_01005 [Solitalea longa]